MKDRCLRTAIPEVYVNAHILNIVESSFYAFIIGDIKKHWDNCNHFSTKIAKSGQTSSHILQSVHLSKSVTSAREYPLGPGLSDMIRIFLGQK